jgi:hypothetical protein
MRAPVLVPVLSVWAIAPSALTMVVLCVTPPTAVVVVMVLNLVGEGEVSSEEEVVILTEEVAVFVAVPVGMSVAREFGRVVCPDVRTAHAPARTTVSDLLRERGKDKNDREGMEMAGGLRGRDSTGSSGVGV